jgi:hypothetical protein
MFWQRDKCLEKKWNHSIPVGSPVFSDQGIAAVTRPFKFRERFYTLFSGNSPAEEGTADEITQSKIYEALIILLTK